jgi:hypothetical protein
MSYLTRLFKFMVRTYIWTCVGCFIPYLVIQFFYPTVNFVALYAVLVLSNFSGYMEARTHHE